MVYFDSFKDSDILHLKITNNLETIDIEKLQSEHYKLMTRFTSVINCIEKIRFPLITSSVYLSSLLDRKKIKLNIFQKQVNKFLDIIYLQYHYRRTFKILKKRFKVFLKKTKESYNQVNWLLKIILITFGLLMSIFTVLYSIFYFFALFLRAIKFFQFKIIILFLIKSHIKNTNSELIVLYSRLKAATVPNAKNELSHRFLLAESIDDCKNFNNTLPFIVNSQLLVGFLSFLTNLLMAIFKNTIISNWLRNAVSQIPNFDILLQQSLLLLFILYLPVIFISFIWIQSFQVTSFILQRSKIYEIQSSIYRILSYKKVDLFFESNIAGMSLLQLFIAINAAMTFVPFLLDIPDKLKFILFIIAGFSIFIIEITKTIYKKTINI